MGPAYDDDICRLPRRCLLIASTLEMVDSLKLSSTQMPTQSHALRSIHALEGDLEPNSKLSPKLILHQVWMTERQGDQDLKTKENN